MVLKGTFERRVRKRRGGEKRCPPHGPIMVTASDEGYYLASCLACGTAGPRQEDRWEAKLACDETVK
jgi:hypothetical protein